MTLTTFSAPLAAARPVETTANRASTPPAETIARTPEAAVPAPVRPPGFSATAPRELVHRAAISEVFVTGWEARGADTHELTAQWPRCHSFFTPPSSSHHMPTLVAETIRQAVFVLAHTEYDIPFEHAFVMHDLHYRTSRAGMRVGDSPSDVQLRASCTRFNRKGRRIAGFTTHMVLYRNGRPFASGGASFTTASPAVYQRLRGGNHEAVPRSAPPAPVCPEYVGRSSAFDVALAPTGVRDVWHVRADTSHPTMFDHPVDHVPGMVLIEAACQAASAASYPRPFHAVSMRSSFSRYAEYGSPCVLTVDRPAEGSVRVLGVQDGQEIFHTTLDDDTGTDPFALPHSAA